MKPYTTISLLFIVLFLIKPSQALPSDSTKLDSTKTFGRFLPAFDADKKTSIEDDNAKNLLLTGRSYEILSNLSEAENHYKHSFETYVRLHNAVGSANAALRLSNVLYQKKQYTEGLKYANYAVKNFEALALNSAAATAYLHLATINRELGFYTKAENDVLKRALSLFSSVGNKNGRLDCFDLLGHIYFDQKKYSQAKWFFIQQNILSRDLKDTLAIVNSLLNLGKVKITIKDYNLALTDLKEAKELAAMAGLNRDVPIVIAGTNHKMCKPDLAVEILAVTKPDNKSDRYYIKIFRQDVKKTNTGLLLSVFEKTLF